MITFRHHVVTIISIFVALAVGVVLGGGPLSELGRQSEPTPDARQTEGPQPVAAFESAFVESVSPSLTSGKLSEQPVAVITLPGADAAVVAALTEQLTSAGGVITATYSLSDQLTAPGGKTLVDTLSSQVVAQQADAADGAATTYVRTGQLLAYATANGEPNPSPVSGKARGVREAVVGAGLMSVEGAAEVKAPRVLVVLGDEPAAEGGQEILAGLLEGLASRTAGLVVAGTVADGAQGGQLASLRSVEPLLGLATVDGVDVLAGRTAAVLALSRALDADGGSFGASGSDGPVPVG